MSQGDLYVGYLPLPPRHKKLVRVTVASIFITLILASAAIAYFQRDPGPAIWHSAEAREFTGVVHTEPYAMLDTEDGLHMVVEAGKSGALERLTPHNGASITLTGFLLERDGRRMIELTPGDDAITPTGASGAALRTTTIGPVTLRGEILDSKCYLGAMKPGDGKAHKACATLCIDGGIPPMLYTKASDGSLNYYLLVAPNNASAAETVRPYIAEPVEVTGEHTRWNNTDVLVVNDIERLGY